MGAKSRGNYPVGMCLKECTHQGNEEICGSCVRFSNLNSSKPEVFELSKGAENRGSYGRDSMRFKPHYNNAFGKYISTKGEYLSEMKKGGYEPYTGEAPKPVRKVADMSETNRVLKAIEGCSNRDGSFSPSANLTKALMDRGVVMSKDSLQRYHNKVREMTR